jgi:hypothetical protein
MSSNNHSKKRNTGLLYEFLIAHISKCLVSGDDNGATDATNLVKEYFAKGTELNKEFRIIQSLYKSRFNNQQIALNLISDAKNINSKINEKLLEKEKRSLLEGINKLENSFFYDHPVQDYKIFATIHTLLTSWRKPLNENFAKKSEYEEVLLEHLTRKENVVEQKQQVQEEIPGMNRLILRLMTGKINEKWSSLIPEQKELIKSWVFKDESKTPLSERLNKIKSNALKSLNDYELESKDNKFVLEKINEIKDSIISEDVSTPNDELISRFMLYVKLVNEICDRSLNNE